MTRITLIFVALFFLSLPAAAQLSQLDFDDAKTSATPPPPKTRTAEPAPAMKSESEPLPAITPKISAPKKKPITVAPNPGLKAADSEQASHEALKVKSEDQEQNSGSITESEENKENSQAKEPAAADSAKNKEKPKLIRDKASDLDLLLPSEADNAPMGMIPVRRPIPITDKDDLITITSEKTWAKPANGNCWDIKEKKLLFDKGAALQEVLYRFSGSEIYHDNLRSQFCVTSCEDPEEKSYITGMLVQSDEGGSFGIKEVGGKCVYQFSKPIDAAWDIFSTAKVICHCTPRYVRRFVPPALKVTVMDEESAAGEEAEELETEIIIPNSFKNAPAEPVE